MILRRDPDPQSLWRRIEAAGWPAMTFGALGINGNSTAWTRWFPTLGPAHLRELEDRLPEIEARIAEHQERQRRYEERQRREADNQREDRRRDRQERMEELRSYLAGDDE